MPKTKIGKRRKGEKSVSKHMVPVRFTQKEYKYLLKIAKENEFDYMTQFVRHAVFQCYGQIQD